MTRPFSVELTRETFTQWLEGTLLDQKHVFQTTEPPLCDGYSRGRSFAIIYGERVGPNYYMCRVDVAGVGTVTCWNYINMTGEQDEPLLVPTMYLANYGVFAFRMDRELVTYRVECVHL
jgi:hypothetical protein